MGAIIGRREDVENDEGEGESYGGFGGEGEGSIVV